MPYPFARYFSPPPTLFSPTGRFNVGPSLLGIESDPGHQYTRLKFLDEIPFDASHRFPFESLMTRPSPAPDVVSLRPSAPLHFGWVSQSPNRAPSVSCSVSLDPPISSIFRPIQKRPLCLCFASPPPLLKPSHYLAVSAPLELSLPCSLPFPLGSRLSASWVMGFSLSLGREPIPKMPLIFAPLLYNFFFSGSRFPQVASEDPQFNL